jgi:hypothetical protein
MRSSRASLLPSLPLRSRRSGRRRSAPPI